MNVFYLYGPNNRFHSNNAEEADDRARTAVFNKVMIWAYIAQKIVLNGWYQHKCYVSLENSLTKWYFAFNKKNTIKNSIYDFQDLNAAFGNMILPGNLLKTFLLREAFF